MAETLSYQPETTTETITTSLTPEEQENLAVGEKLQQDQEQLLAGKYKDAAELEKAYIELQSKLGKENEEPAKETAKPEVDEFTPSNAYSDDGKVNYEAVTETYGSAVTEKLQAAGIDPWSISSEFRKNGGQYSDDMIQKLTGAGFSEAAVKSYFAGQSAQQGYSPQAEDITDVQIKDIKESVGGEQNYANVINWAKSTLAESQTKAFDEVVNSGSVEAIKLAVAGLKAQYDNANGVEGKTYTGKAPVESGDVFRSQAELVRAMSDPLYDSDPAYRQDVVEKLDRSNLEF